MKIPAWEHSRSLRTDGRTDLMKLYERTLKKNPSHM